MAHERIFEHTDGDGDAIRVLSRVQPEKTYLLLRSDANDGSGSVPVRMYPEEVLSLIEALVPWYAVNGSRDITLTTSPQTVGTQCVKDDGHRGTHEYDQPADIPPVGRHDDPALRLEALRLAVQRSAGMDLSRQAVMDIAREFEAYLRGVEPEAPDPSRDSERDCLCHHAKWLHLTPQGTGSNGACRADMCSCTERRPW